MCAELLLHVRIPKYAHLRVKLPVDAQNAAVQLERWEEGEGFAQAGF